MEQLAEYRQELLAALEAVVPRLAHFVPGLSLEAWHLPTAQSGRTPHFLFSRLLQLESQVFAPQLHRIVNEEAPVLPLIDEEAWMAAHYKPDVPAQSILNQFASLRRQEVEWLGNLPPESWSRTARHPRWGVRTLQWWVELQLQYSRDHLAGMHVDL